MPTRITERLRIEHPIVQAPIGSASTPILAAAVSNAGGLGMLAGSWLSSEQLRARIGEVRALTRRPFGVNLVLEWPQAERVAVVIEEQVPVASLFWGDAAPHLPALRSAGIVTTLSVGSTDEARRAVDAGIDVIVAQGWEAGGHVRGQVATMVLVPAIRDVLPEVPLLAAGGIADARGVAAALALGADGVWIGTRFLASIEAQIHPDYGSAILAADDQATVYTTVFDGGWPDAPHRVIRNSTVRAWEQAGRPERPHRPGEHDVVARKADGTPVVRYDDTIPVADTAGAVEALALYAGQSAALIHDRLPAAEIVRRLVPPPAPSQR